MQKYFGVVTSELGSISDNFVVDYFFSNDIDELEKLCLELVRSIHNYPAFADYYIYELTE